MSKLSVIVSVYNDDHDGYLTACMDSLLDQQLDDYEIIAVDDCSTDGSLGVLREYQRRFPDIVRVIEREENGGPGAGKNTGIRAASGEWITYVDHDDIVAPGAYAKLLLAAEREGADLAGGRWQKMDEDGTPYDQPCGLMTFQGSCEIDHDLRLGLVFKGERMWNKIIRRSVIEASGIMLSEGTYIDDAPTTPYWMASCHRYAHVDEVVYFSRELGTSSSRSPLTSKRCREHLLTQHRLIENAKACGVYDELKDAIQCRYFIRGYLRTARKVRLGPMSHEEVMDYYRQLHADLSANAPDFKKNPYIKERMTKREIALAQLFMLSPILYDRLLTLTGR